MRWYKIRRERYLGTSKVVLGHEKIATVEKIEA
jgi:hypothetical protein